VKRILLILIIIALVAPACSSQVDCVNADIFCAGLVMEVGSTEGDLNHQAWLGLQEAESDGLVDHVSYIATNDSRDRANNISVFAEQGYDLIVTVGNPFSDETIAAAQRYPQLVFVGVEQEQSIEYSNLASLVFHEEQGGFLAGALAASITQTHRVAALCEAEFIDQMRRYCEGFQAGAQYADSDVDVTIIYREGSTQSLFHDSAWGQMTALNLIGEGTDVLFAAGGETADSALLASAREGIYVIGADTDRYQDLPETRSMALTSVVKQVASGVYELARLATRGQSPKGNYFGDLTLAPYHDLEERVPVMVREQIAETQRDLAVGTLRTGVVYDLP
jgi:basic membrane protein A